MEDIFEKKIKSFLPYIIIIGAAYLFGPAILMLTGNKVLLNQIFYIGLFPLTALLCCLHYSYKKEMDFFLSLVAPIFFIPSMFIYGLFMLQPLNSIIFLVCYFICSYLGLTIGDMLKNKNGSDDNADTKKKRVPKRVNASATDIDKTAAELMIEDHDIEIPMTFDEEVESESFEAVEAMPETPKVETTFDSTADDIDAILNELRNRRED